MDDNIENKFKDKKLRSGFTTPENYFNELQVAILAGISEARLKEMIGKDDGYEVPEQYFEQLGPRILAGITKNTAPIKKETNVIRLWHSSMLKYATAACFILVAAFGFYFNRHQNIIHKTNSVVTLSGEQPLYDDDDLDEQEIIEHMESETNLQTTTSATSSEIENYILNNYSQNEIARNL